MKVIFWTSPFKWHSTSLLWVQIKPFTNVFRIIFGLFGLSFKFSFKLQLIAPYMNQSLHTRGFANCYTFFLIWGQPGIVTHIHVWQQLWKVDIFLYLYMVRYSHTNWYTCIHNTWTNNQMAESQISFSTHSQPGTLIHIHVYMTYGITAVTMTITFFSTYNSQIFGFEVELRGQIIKFIFWTMPTLHFTHLYSHLNTWLWKCLGLSPTDTTIFAVSKWGHLLRPLKQPIYMLLY